MSEEMLESQETKRKTTKWNGRSCLAGFLVGFIVGLALLLGLYFGIPRSVGSINDDLKIPTAVPYPSYQSFKHAAVATDAGPCSEVGRDILQKGGSVVDSAIGSMLCVGLYNPHSAGIGGGFFMTIYNATTGKATFINSREVAPLKATENMFYGQHTASVLGSLAVAVPGEIAGYWKAHQMHGVLPWENLFAPSIKIAKEGLHIKSALARALSLKEELVHNRSFNMWPIFENNDRSLKKEGDMLYRPQLAYTLEKIAREGSSAFYNGSLTSDLVKDLEDAYGDNIISEKDLQLYKPEIKDTLNVAIDDLTVLTPGPPASGAVMALILNILDGYNFSPDDLESSSKKTLTYHRIVEAFRFAFAKRSSLGDDRNNPEVTELVKNMTADWFADALRLKINDSQTFAVDYYEPSFLINDDHGTAHLSIVGPEGNAVAMTSTINLYFGSKVRGKRTGIIFNNEMDDFSSVNLINSLGVPPSPSNFIKPGNRPMSSMCPSIVIEEDEVTKIKRVRMVAGASGGPKITSATALTIMNSLFFGKDVGTSIEMKRIHNQLLPNITELELGFDKDIIEGLRMKGHDTVIKSYAGSIVQAVVVRPDGILDAASDSRKGGYPAGF